jgi:hypothetical protein
MPKTPGDRWGLTMRFKSSCTVDHPDSGGAGTARNCSRNSFPEISCGVLVQIPPANENDSRATALGLVSKAVRGIEIDPNISAAGF